MSEANSFEHRHEDYAWFLAHTDESIRCREEMLTHMVEWSVGKGRLRMLDFGCGGGEFLEGVLGAWAWPAKYLDLTLVDVDELALPQAERRLARFSDAGLAIESRLDGLSGFDLVLSNHALYYVGEARAAVRALAGCLSRGGMGIWILGGEDNALCQLWLKAFAAANVPLPFLLAADIERELRGLGRGFQRTEISSVLDYADNGKNRDRIARFVFGPHLERLGPERVRESFSGWSCRGRIIMESRDVCLRVDGLGGIPEM